MNQSELKLGKIYSSGKNRPSIRKILDFPSCPDYLESAFCVRYLVIQGLRTEVGLEFTITRRAFAKWAHHEVDMEAAWPGGTLERDQ